MLAGGYVWTPHLLLLSRDAAHPEGLANRSGLVGRYLAGHRNVNAYLRLPLELYPGINAQHSLVSKNSCGPRRRDAERAVGCPTCATTSASGSRAWGASRGCGTTTARCCWATRC